MIEKLQSYWRKHKVKTLGFLMVLAGSAQTQLGQIQAFLKPKHYGMIVAGLGMLVAALGFLNSHQDKNDQP